MQPDPVFTQRQLFWLKLYTLLLIAALVAAILAWRGMTGLRPKIGEPPQQPVPFSHKHHVTDDGIDCRYCHSDVERSSSAGYPPTETCMTCHSQIFTDSALLAPVVRSFAAHTPLAWVRVHTLPDFVYFDHSIHVKKGIGCATCHGRVDRMPLTWREAPLQMKWCIGCHRNPGPNLRPHEEEFNLAWQPPADQDERERLAERLMRENDVRPDRILDCSTCHR